MVSVMFCSGYYNYYYYYQPLRYYAQPIANPMLCSGSAELDKVCGKYKPV